MCTLGFNYDIKYCMQISLFSTDTLRTVYSFTVHTLQHEMCERRLIYQFYHLCYHFLLMILADM